MATPFNDQWVLRRSQRRRRPRAQYGAGAGAPPPRASPAARPPPGTAGVVRLPRPRWIDRDT